MYVFCKGILMSRQMSHTSLLNGMMFEIGKMNGAAEQGLWRG
jgi:hypothetical protein